ncbi:hypothetical protein TREES_T100021703 [Tupaia chinensis]|uniref:Uncharacterized protein n=1 Tax=Tupaia chinensis TaxID=246437 RepID=L9JQS5_TUPCH|nr:hypothetical protein TREES_T100021703 [Tupaia chinensis]
MGFSAQLLGLLMLWVPAHAPAICGPVSYSSLSLESGAGGQGGPIKVRGHDHMMVHNGTK